MDMNEGKDVLRMYVSKNESAKFRLNHSGAGSVDRTTVQGIFNYTTLIAPSEAKPGNIIFFMGTYDSG